MSHKLLTPGMKQGKVKTTVRENTIKKEGSKEMHKEPWKQNVGTEVSWAALGRYVAWGCY